MPERLRAISPSRASIRRPRPSGSSSATSDCSLQFVRDFSERQSQLFLSMTLTFLVRYQPPELQPLIDEDVAEAAAALAATFETASRGVIYEHRPASLPAERLVAALKPLLDEAGQHGGLGVRARRGRRPAAHRGSGRRACARSTPTTAAPFSTCSAASSEGAAAAEDEKPAPPDPPRLIVP